MATNCRTKLKLQETKAEEEEEEKNDDDPRPVTNIFPHHPEGITASKKLIKNPN